MIELSEDQLKAIDKLKNGSILCGKVGSGKSRTALAYYYIKECGGELVINGEGRNRPMQSPRDLYIITTAKKRDSLEWLEECAPFNMDPNTKITIDSWNNIKKYKGVYGGFFIFDEQRVVGKGQWVKSFLRIANRNRWILLSATPGDSWSDYIPVFIANGFYRNRTEFASRHIVYDRFAKYPKIDRYLDQGILLKHRNDILVKMKDQRTTIRHDILINLEYDKNKYKTVLRDRWDPFENKPIQETGKLMYLLRKVVNSDPSRIEKVEKIIDEKERVIIFYNYEFEAELLRSLCERMGVEYGEWSGRHHDRIPRGNKWCYLVQFMAGCEGWNCITSDTIIFYSQSYSYRQTVQAAGRIDRMNTPYTDLYFYHLRSTASIDIAIYKALREKRNFNENLFIRKEKENG